MKYQNRNGVLGLDTVKAVIVTFLILSVTGVAILLALTSLDTATNQTIDIVTRSGDTTITNESDLNGNIAFANQTGYTLSGYNSSWTPTLTAVWGDGNQSNGSQLAITRTPSGFTALLPAGNYSLSSGVLRNATTFEYPNVSVSYTYIYTYTKDLGRVDAIVGNVSSGIVTFFGSTGTIFSILIVVVIILAISIIIWAVGRFGQQGENQTVDL